MRIRFDGDDVDVMPETSRDCCSAVVCCNSCGRVWRYNSDSPTTIGLKSLMGLADDDIVLTLSSFCWGCRKDRCGAKPDQLLGRAPGDHAVQRVLPASLPESSRLIC